MEMWIIHALSLPSASCLNLILIPSVILGYSNYNYTLQQTKNLEINVNYQFNGDNEECTTSIK